MLKKGNLHIKEIQFKDRGIYTCTAENLLSKVHLTVNVTVKGMYHSSFSKRNSNHGEPRDTDK